MVNKAQEFSNSNDINQFFKNFGFLSFSDWFNKEISTDQVWVNERSEPIKVQKEVNWQKVWNNISLLFNRPKINLVEFLCINSIMMNETGGTFDPNTENTGSSGHPGIAYAFDSIGSINKSSYNTLSSNKTAFELFNDPVYKSAHGTKPFSTALKDTTDVRWQGVAFPTGFSGGSIDAEVDKSGKKNTFITEADFMKFRGRGYIQTTGRSNYKTLIQFIEKYTGNNTVILNMKSTWSVFNGNLDSIASASSNQQWDDLFKNTDLIIPSYGVYLHAKNSEKINGHLYNVIDPNQSDSNLQKSIKFVGKKVSGGDAYATKFLQRVLLQLKVLDGYPSKGGVTASVAPVQPIAEAGRLETTGQDPNSQIGKDVNITGSLATISNIFKPTATPGPISFNI